MRSVRRYPSRFWRRCSFGNGRAMAAGPADFERVIFGPRAPTSITKIQTDASAPTPFYLRRNRRQSSYLRRNRRQSSRVFMSEFGETTPVHYSRSRRTCSSDNLPRARARGLFLSDVGSPVGVHFLCSKRNKRQQREVFWWGGYAFSSSMKLPSHSSTLIHSSAAALRKFIEGV